MPLPRAHRGSALALAAALLLALSAGGAGAALIEKAEWVTLENGLQVILIPQKSTPLVASTVIVRAGSRHEPPGLDGATHFLEHLLFNGTARRTQKELYDAIDRIGAYHNASTRADATIFQMLVHRDHAAEGLDIQADMLFHSTLPEEKFEKERGIVIEEIGRSFDRPQAAADRFYGETVFAGTPYSRPVLGTPSSIDALPRRAVVDYYRGFYRPANMTLVLMGGFERDEALSLVKNTFGKEPADPAPTREAVRGLPLRGQRVVGRRAEGQRTYLTLTFAAPPMSDPGYPAFTTLVSLLNAGTTSRLERLFQGEGGPEAYDVDAALAPALEAPACTLSATLPAEEAGPAVIQRLLDELERIARGELTDEEVERAAVEARAEDAFLSENILYYAFFQAPYLAAAPAEWVRSWPSRLQRVTREEVVASAMRYLSGRPFLATLHGPGVAEGDRPWSALAPREGAAPEPHPARAREAPPAEIARRQLANGLTLVVKEAPDSKIFALHLLARNRALLEPEGKTGIAELAHRLLTEGTAHRSAEQVSRDLSSIGAQLKVTDSPAIPYDDYYYSGEYSYLRFEVMDAFAQEGLAQVADLVLYPRFSAEAFERVRRQQLDDIARAEERAQVQAARLFRRTLFGDHPLARPILGTASSVGSVTAEELRAFQATYFAPGNLIITVVGPRPAGEVLGWLAFYFGQMPSGPARSRVWPPLHPTSEAREAALQMGKAQSYLYLGQVLEVPEGWREAVEVMNSILSDRMAFELRERRGLAYSVGSSVEETQAGWYFAAGIGTREENLEEARRAMVEVIRGLQAEAPPEAEVAKTVNGLVGAAFRRRLTGISQAYYLALEAFRGEPLGGEEAWAGRLRKVTPDEVRQASKLLRPEGMVAVTVR